MRIEATKPVEFIPVRHVCSKLKKASSTEKQVYGMLQRRFPDAKIIYEPTEFAQIVSEGKIQATRPDFRIIRPNGPELNLYLEITTSSDKKNDPKERQRRIVKTADPDATLIVLYRRHLEFIASIFPGELQVPKKQIAIETISKDGSDNIGLLKKMKNFISKTYRRVIS